MSKEQALYAMFAWQGYLRAANGQCEDRIESAHWVMESVYDALWPLYRQAALAYDVYSNGFPGVFEYEVADWFGYRLFNVTDPMSASLEERKSIANELLTSFFNRISLISQH